MTRQLSVICLLFLFLQPEGMTQPTAAPTPQGHPNRRVRRDPPAPPKPKKMSVEGTAQRAPVPSPQPTPLPVAKPDVPIKETSELKSDPKPLAKPTPTAQSFKAGLQVFKKDCKMYSKADLKSAQAGLIKSGKKLWVDAHNLSWHKVHKSSGTVLIPADCLAK